MRSPSTRVLLGAAVVVAAALASLVAPTGAQASGTTVTFTLSSGALTISNPATTPLGSSAAGATLTNQLGAVSVSDLRGNLLAVWTATAASSTFTTGTATPAETIAAANVSYSSGLATATTGIGVFTPGQLTTLLATPLSGPKTAYTLTAGVGNSTATWNPTLVITMPAAAVAGSYTGTITHSVA